MNSSLPAFGTRGTGQGGTSGSVAHASTTAESATQGSSGERTHWYLAFLNLSAPCETAPKSGEGGRRLLGARGAHGGDEHDSVVLKVF